jgi:CRISPR/Cas system-associated protein Cas5 (RAMP superfamily)
MTTYRRIESYKKILRIVVLGLLMSGCAESGGEVLSSLIYGIALLGLVLIGLVLYPVMKVTSVVAEALYPKKENTREGKKEIRKEIKKQLIKDKKFIKTRWKNRKWQYPDNRKWQHPTFDDWYEAVLEAKDRIWFADSRNKGPRPRTDKELLFGYNKHSQSFASQIIEVEKRIRHKKQVAKEKSKNKLKKQLKN